MGEVMLNPAALDLSGTTLASGAAFMMLAKTMNSAEQTGAEIAAMLESAAPAAGIGNVGGLMDISA